MCVAGGISVGVLVAEPREEWVKVNLESRGFVARILWRLTKKEPRAPPATQAIDKLVCAICRPLAKLKMTLERSFVEQ